MLNPEGCFNMVASAIENCFVPLKAHEKTIIHKRDLKERRIKFAKSNLLKIWCDCSNNFEYEKLRQLIINYSEKL